MIFKNPRVTAPILLVGLLGMLVAACGGSEPKAQDVHVKIEAGVMSPETIEVKEGNLVTLKIRADEGGEFHLHTYDIEADIEAAIETDFYFVADPGDSQAVSALSKMSRVAIKVRRLG